MQKDTGRWGESISEAMSEKADSQYTEPDAVRYVAHYRVNAAEAAVEHLRKKEKELPLGAQLYVERMTFDEAASLASLVEEVDVAASGGNHAGEEQPS